ncbi:MAG: hypothetical protein LC808_05845, partial [Actinobacteria bacterium]|nr:hypothetical protein [Actinomycetota bacterium]
SMSHVRTVCFGAVTMMIAALFTLVPRACRERDGRGARLRHGHHRGHRARRRHRPVRKRGPDPGAHVPGGHGIVIRADGVTLDLNGHTIFGLGGDTCCTKQQRSWSTGTAM